MRALAFLAVLQSFTTGAYIAAFADSNASAVDWLFAAAHAIISCLFARYVITEGDRGAR
jgi:hypothetical protein